MGICGTDREIASGEYGWPPPNRDLLVLGHESLGEVLEAPEGSSLRPGDLVVGIVRRPDPVPCECCAVGRWDMCRNGLYTERGIKELDGFASETWSEDQAYLVKVDETLGTLGVLLEPASILAKAWAKIDSLVRQSCSRPASVLVTGAGPIGLLAALMAQQRGFDVHVIDVVERGPKPGIVRALGATFHAEGLAEACPDADIVLECTGVGSVFVDVLQHSARNAIVCLTGVSSPGRKIPFDAGLVNRELVLENDLVFGSVNAAREHYEQAADALEKADPEWLDRLITRRVPLSRYREAFEDADDIKVVVDLMR